MDKLLPLQTNNQQHNLDELASLITNKILFNDAVYKKLNIDKNELIQVVS
jgi:hypothetical protein